VNKYIKAPRKKKASLRNVTSAAKSSQPPPFFLGKGSRVALGDIPMFAGGGFGGTSFLRGQEKRGGHGCKEIKEARWNVV